MVAAVAETTTVKVKLTLAPGAAGAARLIAPPVARPASVPLALGAPQAVAAAGKTQVPVVSLLIVRSTTEQKLADPASAGLPVAAALHADGVRVKVWAGSVLMLVMVTVEETGSRGAAFVVPLYLLMAEHVPALAVEMVVPSLDTHVVPLCVSLMSNVPALTLFALLVMP